MRRDKFLFFFFFFNLKPCCYLAQACTDLHLFSVKKKKKKKKIKAEVQEKVRIRCVRLNKLNKAGVGQQHGRKKIKIIIIIRLFIQCQYQVSHQNILTGSGGHFEQRCACLPLQFLLVQKSFHGAYHAGNGVGLGKNHFQGFYETQSRDFSQSGFCDSHLSFLSVAISGLSVYHSTIQTSPEFRFVGLRI